MLNNAENIEAKLCAFVEGDLDEAGRAEIEKHLETHPQHRALLEELRRTKAMMMSLPREQAPVDMAETLQGHLERSVLLDGVGTNELESTMKINRWPQLTGVAAVVLLAAGLGVLVYVVLPEHASTPASFAMKEKDKLPTTQELSRAIQAEDKAKSDEMMEKRELGPLVSSKPVGKGGEEIGLPPVAVEPTAPAAGAVAVAPAGPPAASLTLKGGQATAGNTELAMGKDGDWADAGVAGKKLRAGRAETRRVYVVVSTDNLETTNGQLATYLTTKNIAWQSGERGALLASSQANADISGLKNNGQAYQLNGINTTNGVNTTTNNSVSGSLGNNVNLDSKMGYAQQQQRQNYNEDNNRFNNQYTQSKGGYAAKSAAAPETQNANPDLRQNDDVQLKQKLQTAEQAQAPSFNLAESKTENVIIARGLTRQQATDLSDSLGRLYAGQTAVVVDADAVDAANKAPAGMAAQAGAGAGGGGGAGFETVTIAGVRRDQNMSPTSRPTTNPTGTFDDATAIGGVAAAPSTPSPEAAKPAERTGADQPSRALADQLSDTTDRTREAMTRQFRSEQAKASADAAATEVQKSDEAKRGAEFAGGVGPTTLPVTTEPTTRPVAEIAPQTDLAKAVQSTLTLTPPTTKPADDEPVDVVIVVQPMAIANQAAAPAAAPATQPALDAAQQAEPAERAKSDAPMAK